MAATMNIPMDTNIGIQKGIPGNLIRSIFLAPRFSGKTVILFTFAYLTMITIFLIMAANPFGPETSLDFGVGPKTTSPSNQVATGALSTILVQILEVPIPAVPYIIFDPAD